MSRTYFFVLNLNLSLIYFNIVRLHRSFSKNFYRYANSRVYDGCKAVIKSVIGWHNINSLDWLLNLFCLSACLAVLYMKVNCYNFMKINETEYCHFMNFIVFFPKLSLLFLYWISSRHSRFDKVTPDIRNYFPFCPFLSSQFPLPFFPFFTVSQNLQPI